MAKRKNNIMNAIRKRLKTRGLFTFLAIGSIIGFAGNSLSYLTGYNPFSLFNYTAILLGAGLIFEARIRNALSSKKEQSFLVMKVITFLVGIAILAGGLLTIPALSIKLPDIVTGIILFANIIAIFVIFIEAFLVD